MVPSSLEMVSDGLESRGELIKPGNDGILEVVEQADEIFVNESKQQP